MRTPTRIVLGLCLLVVTCFAGTLTRASCSRPYIFNQTPDGYGPHSSYTYIVSPGRYELDGAFWALGNSVGPDRVTNGTFPFSDWHRIYEGNHYIAGAWGSDNRIRGCIRYLPSPVPSNMAVGVWDQSPDGKHGYFGVMCVHPSPAPIYDFDFTDIDRDLELVDMPGPVVVGSSRIGSTLQLAGRVDPFSGGTQTDGHCPPNLATGYRLYYQRVPLGGTEPADRRTSAGWIAGPAAPVGSNVTLKLPCAGDCPAVYVAATLILDGIETGVVSAQLKPSVEEDTESLDSDLDGVPNVHDNCILSFNSEQRDLDSDGQGDVCDLDDGNIVIGFGSPRFVEWQQEDGFEAWDIYVGDMDILRATGEYTQLPGSNPLAEQHCQVPWTFVAAPNDVPSGKVAFWLVLGRQDGASSSLGYASNGVERFGTLPCP